MKTVFKGSHSLMAIKFVLMAVRFGDLELLLIFECNCQAFQTFQSIKCKQYLLRSMYKFNTVFVLFKLHPLTRVPLSYCLNASLCLLCYGFVIKMNGLHHFV